MEGFGTGLMDAIKVTPDARPVVIALIETLMDNRVPQESWGPIFFRLWQELNHKPSSGRSDAPSARWHHDRRSLLPLSRGYRRCALDLGSALCGPHDRRGERRWS
jgi:hypothetical protein